MGLHRHSNQYLHAREVKKTIKNEPSTEETFLSLPWMVVLCNIRIKIKWRKVLDFGIFTLYMRKVSHFKQIKFVRVSFELPSS